MSVRFAVVGYGNIGRAHVSTLLSDAVPDATVSAVVERNAVELPAGIERYAHLDDLLERPNADVVLIATPTLAHYPMAKAALAADCHVLVEKPLAMAFDLADELAAAARPDRLAAVMLNQRWHGAYRRMHEIVRGGGLGRLRRFHCLMTTWYRPNAYFAVSDWRGTWQGEGGGALLNQCIHNLDALQWILGLPASVIADISFGKYHPIEVEDEVSALLRYDDGLTGTLVCCTGEAPGTNLFEIVGDEATLRYDGERLTLTHATPSVPEHCATTTDLFGLPDFATEEIAVEEPASQHACVLNNVVAAVRGDATLATPFSEGLGSLELAGALLLSAWQDLRVTLPLDRAAFRRAMDIRLADSRPRDAAPLDVAVDMDASYR
ncbi:MAG: Gfo/Idh/MocA family oxidoreductase [Pseudomonadota bacterium]